MNLLLQAKYKFLHRHSNTHKRDNLNSKPLEIVRIKWWRTDSYKKMFWEREGNYRMGIMGRLSSLHCAVRVCRPVVLSLPRVRPLPPLRLFLRRLFLIGRSMKQGPVCVNRRWRALLRAKGQPPAVVCQTLRYCFLLSLRALWILPSAPSVTRFPPSAAREAP